MSGAKNCPETPRQRMIGMMYLVLTAMLALNVSSEILNGFTMVDNSLHSTIESSDMRNKLLYEDFNYLDQQNHKKVEEWLNKAKHITKESDELFNYIEKFKIDIIKLADKGEADPEGRIIKARDNLDVAGRYAILGGKGKELKSKINAYCDTLVNNVEGNPTKQKVFKTIFSTEKIKSQLTGEMMPWENAMFEMMPVSAVVTILTKYQSDIRASESEMIQSLKSRLDQNDYRVNSMKAYVVAKSGYVMKNGKYSAQIILSAVDSTKKPLYYINGGQVKDGIYEVNCGKSGLQKYSGNIMLPNAEGTMIPYPFNGEYMVGEPSATISNEDLNVIYMGVDNNFRISAPGVAAENLVVSVSGARCTSPSKGKYVITTTSFNEVTVSVKAKIDGKEMVMGVNKFRVKKLPDPMPYLQYTAKDGNEKQANGGYVPLSTLANARLIASQGPDALVKANFRILSFTMLVKGLSPASVTGERLNASFVGKLRSGDYLILADIKAVGPGGTFTLPSLAIQI